MLEAVKEVVPGIFSFVHSVYKKKSYIFFGNDILQSLEGVQQVDPLGPLLFCLAVHSLGLSLKSEFRVLYLDAATLGGSMEDVFWLVESSAFALGMQLKHSKTELICKDPAIKEAMLLEVPVLLYSSEPRLCRAPGLTHWECGGHCRGYPKEDCSASAHGYQAPPPPFS